MHKIQEAIVYDHWFARLRDDVNDRRKPQVIVVGGLLLRLLCFIDRAEFTLSLPFGESE